MDHDHNAQLVNISRTIPPMIQHAIKMVMKRVVVKLGSLYARVDMLEGKVATLRDEMDRRKAMVLPMDIDLNIPTVVSDSPVAKRSPPDDWYVGTVRQVVQQLKNYIKKSSLAGRLIIL
ncbi:hypothetical protein HAX54_037589 [Datura stramonium]|uniref:Uncharacterized protein n=1 Tax=Datura stramonium TaxID=4076 RepID=A0ABS8SHB5_DATST|nr:hypothetical protein [Datura stramonium]